MVILTETTSVQRQGMSMKYPLKVRLLRLLFKILRKNPLSMEMVRYWKYRDTIEPKVTKAEDGSTIMIMRGEKYPIQGFPRQHILHGPLSPLKHWLKNRVFNEAWHALEQGREQDVIDETKVKLWQVLDEWFTPLKYDLMPPGSMTASVREVHRALTVVAQGNTKILQLRDALTLILQEDDAYRYRLGFVASWFPLIKWNPIKCFDYSLEALEHAEVVDDMKERMRLLRRILMTLLKDKRIKELFLAFFKECDWKKVKLTKADKYHLRAKYFRADLDKFSY